MLTARETLAAAFAATAHRDRDAPAVTEVRADTADTTTWGALALRVRQVSLGLAARSDGGRASLLLDPAAPLTDRAVVLLAAAATGAVAVVPVPGTGHGATPLDLSTLAEEGAGIDDRDPAGYESLVARRVPEDDVLRRGEVVHTHGSLLVAGRALAQVLDASAEDRLSVELHPASVAAIVAAVVVPSLTGAASQAGGSDGGSPGGGAAPPTVRLVVPGTAGPPAVAPAPRRRRRPEQALRVLAVLDALADEPIAERVSGAQALAVDAAGGVVTGFGTPGTLGRPLPGTSVAIADDGEVLVRSRAVPPGAPDVRDDGWLGTGLQGSLVAGALVLEGSRAAGAT